MIGDQNIITQAPRLNSLKWLVSENRLKLGKYHYLRDHLPKIIDEIDSFYQESDQSLESYGQLIKATMRAFIVANEKDAVEKATR